MKERGSGTDIDNRSSNQGVQGVFHAPVTNTNRTKEGLLTQTNAIIGITIGLIVIITIIGFRAIGGTSTTSTSSPEGVLLQFLVAVNIGDMSTLNSLSTRDGNNQFSANVNANTKTSECLEPSIAETKMAGATARISVNCKGRGTRMYILLQEEGEWKVQTLR